MPAQITGKIELSLKMAVDTGATYTMIPVESAIAIGCDPVEGLLGLNFLKSAKVIIDFSRNIIANLLSSNNYGNN